MPAPDAACLFEDTRAIYHYECTHRDGRVTHGSTPWCTFNTTPPAPLLARVRLAALGDLDPDRPADAPVQLGEVSCSVIGTKATTQATLADAADEASDLQAAAVRRGCAPSFTAPRGLAVANNYTCTYHGTLTDPISGNGPTPSAAMWASACSGRSGGASCRARTASTSRKSCLPTSNWPPTCGSTAPRWGPPLTSSPATSCPSPCEAVRTAPGPPGARGSRRCACGASAAPASNRSARL